MSTFITEEQMKRQIALIGWRLDFRPNSTHYRYEIFTSDGTWVSSGGTLYSAYLKVGTEIRRRVGEIEDRQRIAEWNASVRDGGVK